MNQLWNLNIVVNEFWYRSLYKIPEFTQSISVSCHYNTKNNAHSRDVFSHRNLCFALYVFAIHSFCLVCLALLCLTFRFKNNCIFHLLTYRTFSSPTKNGNFSFPDSFYTILFATFSLYVKASMQKIRKHWTNVYTHRANIFDFLFLCVFCFFARRCDVRYGSMCVHTVKWLWQNWSDESVWQTRFINSTPYQHIWSQRNIHINPDDASIIAMLIHIWCLFHILFLLWLLALSVGRLGRILCPVLIFIISSNSSYLQ